MFIEQSRLQGKHVPQRRYWTEYVTPQGKQMIEQMRIQKSPDYLVYNHGGFYAVDDIPQQQGIFAKLTDEQRKITMGWVITAKINELEALDRLEGRTRRYAWVEGAVRPRRGRPWRDIAEESHVTWQRRGITIIAKDITDIFDFASYAAESLETSTRTTYSSGYTYVQ